MSALDFALSCVALLIWLNWRSRSATIGRAAGIALAATLRRAEPARRDRWRSPTVLATLLLLRAIIYLQLGDALRWTPRLNLGAISMAFPTDRFSSMLVYSILAFVVLAAAFYFSAMLLSAVNQAVPATEPPRGFLRMFLGRLDQWPAWLKLLLPFLVSALAWTILGPFLAFLGVLVPAISFGHWIQQGLLLGVAACLSWKYVIVAVLLLHIVTSYVYFGNSHVWAFVTITGRNLVRPFSWLPLQFGKLDLVPILVLVAFCAAIQLIESSRLLANLFTRLPF